METRDAIVKKTLCGMCPITCAINVHVRNGKMIKVSRVDGHFLKGMCWKIGAIKEYQYSKQRILNPLKKEAGNWKKISWQEALESIATQLHNIKNKSGPEALVVHLGNAHVFQQTENIAHRFCDVYGTPNYTSGAAYCHFSRVISNGLTFGSASYGVFAYPMYRGTKCMVLWGTNPKESAYPISGVIPFLKEKRGAKLIVIDPRKTSLAKQADIHAQLRPGTDSALGLAILNVIISERLYNEEFVNNYTVGFKRLAEHVKQYSPEKMEDITWVQAETVRDIASLYATAKPAMISQGVSIELCTNGIQAGRTIAALMAVTGNINAMGGNYYYPSFRGNDLRLAENVKARPFSDYPIFSEIVRETQDSPLSDAILSGKPYPIRGLVVQGANPLLTSPNTHKLIKAYEKLDLLVVIDHFMTDTAKRADIILPPTTFLERMDLVKLQGRPLIDIRERIIDPPKNCMDDWKIWAALAHAMGEKEYFPWATTENLIETLLEPTGITIEKIRDNINGYEFGALSVDRHLKEGFSTPSGKVELYSKTLEEHGYDPLPTYHEPEESPLSKPNLVKEYPLVLITGCHVIYYTHSRFRNLPKMINKYPYPLVEVNAETAKARGISDGDMAIVESPRGSIRLKTYVTDDILPNIISILYGWSEANANLLTDDESRDPISGYPGFRSLLCNLRKA